MIKLTVQMDDNATPAMEILIRRLKDRTQLHQWVGRDLKSAVRRYVLEDSANRHNTSQRLGATPSNFVGKAVKSIEASEPLADGETATLLLPHAWFARAFGDVRIQPLSGLYLTIPWRAEAYNQRAAGQQGLFFITSKSGKKWLAKKSKSGGKNGLELWYLLVNSVFQSEDRTRLPSDEDLQATAMKSTRDYLIRELEIVQRNRGRSRDMGAG